MRSLWFHLLILVAVTFPVAAGERPSSAIISAANTLIAERALFLPAGDGFVRSPDDSLVQFHLPEKVYTKQSRAWRVELRSKRWRKYQSSRWEPWNDAMPHHAARNIGVIQVDVLTSGVRARWVNSINNATATAPTELEVRRVLDTHGQSSVSSDGRSQGIAASRRETPPTAIDPVVRALSRPAPPAASRIPSIQRAAPFRGALPPGMSRAAARSAPGQAIAFPSPPPAGIPDSRPAPPASRSIAPTRPPHPSRQAPVGAQALNPAQWFGTTPAHRSPQPPPALRIPTLDLIWPPLVLTLLVLLVARISTSPVTKGWLGESAVKRGLANLDPTLYQSYHDLYLPRPDGKGSTQIDHIVVSKFGIFVIETKNYKGWIFGSGKQPQWTQQIFRAKHRFQNPLHQNYLHVKALMRFLGQPEDHFHPLVFFIGSAEFKTPMPTNVLNRGLLPWITAHTNVLFTQEPLKNLNFRLDTLSRSTDRDAAAREHLAAMTARNA